MVEGLVFMSEIESEQTRELTEGNAYNCRNT